MIVSILLNKEIFFVLSDKNQCIQKTESNQIVALSFYFLTTFLW